MEAPHETAAELLEMQARLRVLRKRFDVSTSECQCCSLTKYDNRAEYNAAQQIDGAIGRLEKVIETIGEAQLGPWVVAVTWLGSEDDAQFDCGNGMLSWHREDARTYETRDKAERAARRWDTNAGVLDASAVLR